MRRTVATLAALTLVAFGATSATAAPPQLVYACSPTPANCGGWFRGSVKLSWDWNDIAASPTSGNCSEQFFTSDTKGTKVFCEITDDVSGEYTGLPVTIRVDRTSPTVAALPDRPPDYGAWFNHPVTVGFAGSDATSGVASCSSAGYGGPDGQGVQISGTCTDVAGNTGAGSFALNYDATPPAAPSVSAIPDNRRLDLGWTLPTDSEAVEISQITGDGSPDLLFRGAGGRFAHKGLKNGKRYRYLIASVDRAGNRAFDRATGVPTSLPLLSPARNARLGQAPKLLWERVRRARYYNVQLYRGSRKVLSRWPRGTSFQLPKLDPGRYRWFIFPGFGERKERRYGRLLGKSRFTVTGS